MECEFCQDARAEHFVLTRYGERHLCERCRGIFELENDDEITDPHEEMPSPDVDELDMAAKKRECV